MIATMMPFSQMIAIQERVGKCPIREFTCYGSSEQITSNPIEKRHLKDVVVSEPDAGGSEEFQATPDGCTKERLPSREE